jgi:hypothetical protein
VDSRKEIATDENIFPKTMALNGDKIFPKKGRGSGEGEGKPY